VNGFARRRRQLAVEGLEPSRRGCSIGHTAAKF
jgi:hypothetical protein